MLNIGPVNDLPVNFGDFLEEVAAGLEHLHGPEAGQDYRAKARRAFSVSVGHPSVRGFAAHLTAEGGCPTPLAAAGLLFCVRRGAVAELSYLHVLRAHEGQGIEEALVATAVDVLRTEGIHGVVSDFTPMGRLDLEAAFIPLGFERMPRQLMEASLAAPHMRPPTSSRSVPMRTEDWPNVAECIVDAYTRHPGRLLHGEVHDPAHAMDFLARISAGNYGAVQPGYQRAILGEGRCLGTILGCQIAPTTGFVLQVAVRRDHRHRGLGTALVCEASRSFRAAGLERLVLGVTVANPARRLYEHLGFTVLRPIDAYVWWREGYRPAT